MKEEPQQLRAWLDFYEEMGLTPFMRRPPRAPASVNPPAHPAPAPRPVPAATLPPVVSASRASTLSLFGEAPGRLEGETLEDIERDLGDCRRCKLWPDRKHIVFGTGNPRAQLVFVGEGPGAEEDTQGLPFVGRAGQLLNHWIESLGLRRPDVYICNVIKCRPPGNRTPERDEIETCSPFLLRQLDAIHPRLICCLGGVAVQTLLGKPVSITRLRGQLLDFRGLKMMATFHPAYILRNPDAMRDVRVDLDKIRQLLA
ncbi:MAG: uracil-DNA glycosylase [Candidatus Acidiferrales bacterium]